MWQLTYSNCQDSGFNCDTSLSQNVDSLIPTEMYWWRVLATNSKTTTDRRDWSDWLKVAQSTCEPEQAQTHTRRTALLGVSSVWGAGVVNVGAF